MTNRWGAMIELKQPYIDADSNPHRLRYLRAQGPSRIDPAVYRVTAIGETRSKDHLRSCSRS